MHIYHEKNLLKYSYSYVMLFSYFFHNLKLKMLFFSIYTPDRTLPELPFNVNSLQTHPTLYSMFTSLLFMTIF